MMTEEARDQVHKKRALEDWLTQHKYPDVIRVGSDGASEAIYYSPERKRQEDEKAQSDPQTKA